MLFNGIDAVFAQIEIIIKIFKKERNILTANSIVSLRNLAAYNGFEPELKIPAKGLISITISPKLFNTVGYPLYLPPYAILTNTENGINYYHDSNKVLKLDNNVILVPIVEGQIQSKNEIASGKYIERFYLDSDAIAKDSLLISVGIEYFTEVKSFFDNENLFDNKQFVIKYSNKPDAPIVLYIKGLNINDSVNITYRLTSGELGNIDYKANFTTEAIINGQGTAIEISDNDATIISVSGFNFGSNGTDENSLRSAIGFNHGTNLLFDSVSYGKFLNKFSTVLLQSIKLSEFHKSINNIYISKRQYINVEIFTQIETQYKNIVDFKKYLLSKEDINNLDEIISENEFALSSHNIYDALINKFAFQILFDNEIDSQKYAFDIRNLIYIEFSKFLYNNNHSINIEILLNDFMLSKNIKFEYTVFNENIENTKLLTKAFNTTPYIINNSEGFLPLLNGSFNICDNNFNPVKLFFDINIVSKSAL